MNTNIYFHMGSVFSIDYYFCQLNDVDGCDIPPETNTKKKEYRIFNGKYNHVLRTVSLFSSRDNELPKTKSYFRYNNKLQSTFINWIQGYNSMNNIGKLIDH